MRRSEFKRKVPPLRPSKQYDGVAPSAARAPAVRVQDKRAQLVVPIPKENALQHLGYMALVRLLPCDRCTFFQKGKMQFCHADMGKGTGIKTDCRRGWSGCRECHWFVGTSGQLTKEERRTFEAEAGARTRAKILAAGKWPAKLPRWPE